MGLTFNTYYVYSDSIKTFGVCYLGSVREAIVKLFFTLNAVLKSYRIKLFYWFFHNSRTAYYILKIRLCYNSYHTNSGQSCVLGQYHIRW